MLLDIYPFFVMPCYNNGQTNLTLKIAVYPYGSDTSRFLPNDHGMTIQNNPFNDPNNDPKMTPKTTPKMTN